MERDMPGGNSSRGVVNAVFAVCRVLKFPKNRVFRKYGDKPVHKTCTVPGNLGEENGAKIPGSKKTRIQTVKIQHYASQTCQIINGTQTMFSG
jgi:hypothetical protein